MKTTNKAQIRDALEVFYKALSSRTEQLELEMLREESNERRSKYRDPRFKDVDDLLTLFKSLFHHNLIKPDQEEP